MSNTLSKLRRQRRKLQEATEAPTLLLSFQLDQSGETPTLGKVAMTFDAPGYPEIMQGDTLTNFGAYCLVKSLRIAIDQVIGSINDDNVKLKLQAVIDEHFENTPDILLP
jgi:hypothetical protein